VIRLHQVIAIAEYQPWGRGQTCAGVSGKLNSTILYLLVLDFAAKLAADPLGIVRRTIVYYDHFTCGKCLGKN
jgi:hypothetical protein